MIEDQQSKSPPLCPADLPLLIMNEPWKPLSRAPTLSRQPQPYMSFLNEEKMDAYEDDKATDVYEDDEDDDVNSDCTEVDVTKNTKESITVESILANTSCNINVDAPYLRLCNINKDGGSRNDEGGSTLSALDDSEKEKEEKIQRVFQRRSVRSRTKRVNYTEPSLATKLRREEAPKKPKPTFLSPNSRVSKLFKNAKGENIHISQEQDQLSREILVLSTDNSFFDLQHELNEPPKKRLKTRKITDDYCNVSISKRVKCEVMNCRNNAAFKNSKCQKHGGRPKCRVGPCGSFAQRLGLCRLHGKSKM